MSDITAICPCCHERVLASAIETRRMNTAYEDEERNYIVSCLACWEYSETLWAAQWAEYNAERR